MVARALFCVRRCVCSSGEAKALAPVDAIAVDDHEAKAPRRGCSDFAASSAGTNETGIATWTDWEVPCRHRLFGDRLASPWARKCQLMIVLMLSIDMHLLMTHLINDGSAGV